MSFVSQTNASDIKKHNIKTKTNIPKLKREISQNHKKCVPRHHFCNPISCINLVSFPSVPKLPQQPGYPHPKPKTTRSPAASPTELGNV